MFYPKIHCVVKETKNMHGKRYNLYNLWDLCWLKCWRAGGWCCWRQGSSLVVSVRAALAGAAGEDLPAHWLKCSSLWVRLAWYLTTSAPLCKLWIRLSVMVSYLFLSLQRDSLQSMWNFQFMQPRLTLPSCSSLHHHSLGLLTSWATADAL